MSVNGTDVISDVFDNVITNATGDVFDDVIENATTGVTYGQNSTPAIFTVDQYYYLRIASAVWRYGSPVLICVGTIGNVLSAIVMLRKELCQGSTTSLYLAVLAFVDFAILYTGLLRQWIFRTFEIDLRALSETSCRLHPFLTYAFMQYQAWVIVNVAVERLVAVFVPHKTAIIFTRRRVVICLIVTAFIICCINFHFFFTMSHVVYVFPPGDYDGDGVKDDPPPQVEFCATKHFITSHWPWIHIAVFSIVPSAILIGCNLAIIFKMASVRHLHDRSAAAQSRITAMTIILLVVSLFFLLTTAPISIYLIMNEFLGKQSTNKFNEMQLAFAFLNMILYTNNVANFFLYCISGTRFRHEVMDMLCACCGVKKRGKDKASSYVLNDSRSTMVQSVNSSVTQ